MSKKLVFLVILSLIIGGLFYFLFIWEVPKEPGQETSQGPTLFAKEDYKIDEREDGKYIVVEKVGLTCKVPEEWDIKIEGDDYPEPEYWVNLSSPDAEFEKSIPTKGCGISIIIGQEEENIEDIKNNVKMLQENPNIMPEEISNIYKGYKLNVIDVSNHQALFWIAPEKSVLGQGIGVNIPINNKNLISFNTRFLPNYKEKCSPIWEEFIKNIIIE